MSEAVSGTRKLSIKKKARKEKKETKQDRQKTQNNDKNNYNMLVSTINIKVLNLPIKKCKISDWIESQLKQNDIKG